jgi:hypothetical protein
MRITVEVRRPARRSIALVLGALLVLAPAVVLASHQFPDVPAGNPFHSQIDAIAEAGITAGFSDGTYRPSDPVTRQSMAAFMHRGFGRVGLVVGTAPETAQVTVSAATTTPAVNANVPVRQLLVTVPGASNSFSPNQLVHLQGRVTLSGVGATNGCPCTFRAAIVDTTTNSVSFVQEQTFEGETGMLEGTYSTLPYSFAVEALFAAPPGNRIYELRVGLTQRRSTTANAANFPISNASSLSAMTFPFGPTGGSSLE